MKTFWWDFFGPRAEGTAQHFLVHLRQFLQKNACPDMPTGLRSEAALHYGVYCSPPADFRAAIERSLRPRRVVDDAEGT